jgi:hypothetical protein
MSRAIAQVKDKFSKARVRLYKATLVFFVLCIYVALLFAYVEVYGSTHIPAEAYKHRSFLIREARFEHGLNAPVALFASQIHQESAWRPHVSSPFADGLTQFTPDTAKWIAELYPDLGNADVFNPKWAIRAMLRYDKHLYSLFTTVTSDCDRWAFVLSSYNGGYGWIKRDRAMAIENGLDPAKWWGNVEKYSPRAAWAFTENRDYPRKIVYTHQEKYLKDGNRWTGSTVCLEGFVEVVEVVEIVEVIEVTEAVINDLPGLPVILPENPVVEVSVETLPVSVEKDPVEGKIERSVWERILLWFKSVLAFFGAKSE